MPVREMKLVVRDGTREVLRPPLPPGALWRLGFLRTKGKHASPIQLSEHLGLTESKQESDFDLETSSENLLIY